MSVDTIRDGLVLRYRELVDKKYISGLTTSEAMELIDLAAEVDKTLDVFYQDKIALLKQMAEERDASGL